MKKVGKDGTITVKVIIYYYYICYYYIGQKILNLSVLASVMDVYQCVVFSFLISPDLYNTNLFKHLLKVILNV